MRYRVVFDTSILIHRNYHSIKKNKRVTVNGLYKRVTDSISSVLMHLASKHKFLTGHTVLCLDSESFRYQISPEYKAGRVNTKNSKLATLLPQLYKKLAEGYDCIQHEGLEADDLCYLFSQKYDHCVLVSEDGDFLQMSDLNRHIFVYQPFKRRLMEDADRYYEALEKLLVGCTSDNIPKAYEGRLGSNKLKKLYEESKDSDNVLLDVISRMDKAGVKVKKDQLNVNRMIAVYDLTNYQNFVKDFKELWEDI